MPIPLQVALIAALVALVGAGINFLSSLLNHWYTHNAKIREWVFDRKVADVEKILTVIKLMLVELEDTENELSTVIFRPFGIIQDSREAMAGKTDYSFQPEVLYRKAAGIWELGEAFFLRADKQGRAHTAWMNHELIQITTWFDDAGESEKELRTFFQKYVSLLRDWSQVALKMKSWSRDNKFEINESTISHLEALLVEPKNDFVNLGRERRVLIEEGVRLQKFMASKVTGESLSFRNFLRHSLTQSKEAGSTSTTGGLLVKLAYWTEEKLRNLIGLR